MLKVIDKITGDELTYEDIEDFRETSKHSFDESVHDVIDKLADAYKANEYIGGYEEYLGIDVSEDTSVEVKIIYKNGSVASWDEDIRSEIDLIRLRNDAWAEEFPFDEEGIASIIINGEAIV